ARRTGRRARGGEGEGDGRRPANTARCSGEGKARNRDLTGRGMSSEIFEAVESLSRSKGIDVDKVIEALEEAIVARFDRQTGQMQAYARMTVVDQVEEAECQIDVREARQMKPDAKPGDALF